MEEFNPSYYPIRLTVAAMLAAALVALGARQTQAAPSENETRTEPPTPPKAPQEPNMVWNGFYAGGSAGYLHARSSAPGAITKRGSDGQALDTLVGSIQGGYAHLVSQHLLLGLDGDIAFPNFRGNDDRLSSTPAGAGHIDEKLDALASLRARAGYAVPRGLVYATAGVAWGTGRFLFVPDSGNGEEHAWRFRTGYCLGGGWEFALTPVWTLRMEYRYVHLGPATATFASGQQASSLVDGHSLGLGLDWRFPPPKPEADATEGRAIGASPNSAQTAWNIHGQTTFVGQGYPGFRSPYEGPQSLGGASQFKHTLSATAFLGLRPWRGGEIYFNPELMQGFGLSEVHGVAAFPNGEAQKSNFPSPRFNAARIYASQTFGFGDGREFFDDGPNQLPGPRDLSRLTVTVGKLAVTDFFLTNRFAGEPRTGFLNWNIYGGGSYDWTINL